MTVLGELLSAILALAKEPQAGTIDRIMEKSDIELGLEYFSSGARSDQG